ncbi:MAG: EamA family transporter [Rhodobacteraceae bacterium]|nr:EamA family transporter [Paracoccaceae bacterium]
MDLRAIGMGLAFAFMWSSAFTTGHIIVAAAPPLYALAVRFLIAGLIGVSIAAAMGQTMRLTSQQWRGTFLFGLCQNALYLGLYFVAMQTVDASLASIIASTMPLVVALAGWIWFGEPVKPLGAAGLVAGFLGVTVIMASRMSGGGLGHGILLCGLGVLALAFATLTVRGASSGGNLLMIVGLQMFVGSVLLGAVAAVTEVWVVQWSLRLVLAFLYTTLVPGLLATWVWFKLVNRIGAVRAATFHFLNPFFGVLVAALMLHEKVGPTDVLGVAIIAGGILAVQLSKQAPKPAAKQASR